MKINSTYDIILENGDLKYFYFGYEHFHLNKIEEERWIEEFSTTINKRLKLFTHSKKSKNTKIWTVLIIYYLWHYKSDEKRTPFMYVKLEDLKRDLLSRKEKTIGRPRKIPANDVSKGRNCDLTINEKGRITTTNEIPYETTFRRILNDLIIGHFLHIKRTSPKKILYRLNARAFVSDSQSIYEDFDPSEGLLEAAKNELSWTPREYLGDRLIAAIQILKKRGVSHPEKEIKEYILQNIFDTAKVQSHNALKESFKTDFINRGKDPKEAERLADIAAWRW